MTTALQKALAIAAVELEDEASDADNRVKRCAEDIREFAKHAWLSDPVLGEMPFAMWDWQEGMLELWTEERLVCVLKARQLGVSWLVAVYVLWVALFRPSQRILLVSIDQRESDKLLDKVKFVLKKLPDWLKPPASLVTQNTRIVKFLAHDSEIEALPSTGKVGRSRAASVVVLDEHAHQDNADDIFVAIEPTIEHGQMLSVSTANGLGVLHTRLYKGAVEGGNGFTPVFVPWMAHPDRDEEWERGERARLSATEQPQLFEQEYPATDVEAFVVTGNPVWTVAEVNRQPIEHIEPTEPGLWLYREPVKGYAYALGADPAEGVKGGDWCSASVWHIWKDEAGYHGEQVAQLRGLWAPEKFAEKVDALALRYSVHHEPRRARPVMAGVERNNHGHAVLMKLRQLNPKDQPYSLSFWSKKLGWVTTPQTRPLMYDEFAGAIREGQVVVHDPVTQSQMSTFAQTRLGGDAQQGYHDDDLTAGAIAWQHHRRVFGVVIGARGKAA